MKNKSASANVKVERQTPSPVVVSVATPAHAVVAGQGTTNEPAAIEEIADPASAKMCSLLDPTCEACQ